MNKNSIENHFSNLDDPRRPSKNILHKFIDVLSMSICAVLCGCDNWVSVEAFCKAKEEWFRTFLELPNGIPSHDTFTDIFTKLSPDNFQNCFISWVKSISEYIPDEVVAIDGKTLRRSYTNKNLSDPIHIVSAYASENMLVLGQVKTAKKSNEITAIPELLKLLDISGCLITIDAMGCQTKIVDKIIEGGADFLIAVKDNQPTLHESLIEIFMDEKKFNNDDNNYYVTEEKSHGRLEKRECFVSTDIPDKILKKWMHVKSVVMIKASRSLDKREDPERRYYISSSVNHAPYLLNATRRHWAIENSLHWSLDVSFREDESRIRTKHGAQNFAILRHIALNLLKTDTTKKVGIAIKRQCAGWENNYLKKLLKGLKL